MTLGWALAVLGTVGCGDARTPVIGDDAASTSTSTSTSSAGTSSAGTSSAGTSSGSDGLHTTAVADSTGIVFLLQPDGGVSFECHPLLQDCSPGEKCTPWSNDGRRWNRTKCVPIVDDPAGVDEPCRMEGSPYSGIDDCDSTSMCFYVDPVTLEGICTPFCTGDEIDPQCEADRFCTLGQDTLLVVCLPRCNPLQQDCAPGQSCYEIVNEWGCGPDGSGKGGAYGDPCESIGGCDPGLLCLNSSTVPPGQPCEGVYCCTEVCDLSDPLGDLQCAGAAGGQICNPWYDAQNPAPAGLEDVGVCSLPP